MLLARNREIEFSSAETAIVVAERDISIQKRKLLADTSGLSGS
jgi:hypothetical protein